MIFDAIVVGAGITGLTTAYIATNRGKKVLVLEKQSRAGGNIKTLKVEIDNKTYLFEEGPQTILANNEAVYKLINSLPVEVVKASPTSNKRFIYKRGKLIPIPLKPWEFFLTPLVSLKSKLLLFREFFEKPIQTEDESVASFVRRHFGEEFLNYFVQPFVSGIYAGDAQKLSLRYGFPKLWEIQKRYGSLLKAFFKEKRVAPKGELISFRGGLIELIRALEKKVNLLTDAEVLKIKKTDGNLFEVISKKGTFKTKKVIITIDAQTTARLLKPLYPPIEVLKEIYYPPLAVVSLSVPKIGLEGFGFLVPPKEGLKILGAIFVSSLFEYRCPKEEDCFSVFLCGDTQKEVCQQKEEEILLTAQREIKRVFPQIKEFRFRKIRLWKKSIPQYWVGYQRYMNALEGLRKVEPNILVISNFVEKSSLAGCIEKGFKVGERI